MFECQKVLKLCLAVVAIIFITLSSNSDAIPTAAAEQRRTSNESLNAIISEDIIPDIHNRTLKVIRLSPVDLPPLKDDTSAGVVGTMDSSLFKIQTLLPIAHRRYVNSERMRKPRPLTVQKQGEEKLQKPKQAQKHKQKQLHFLYDQIAPVDTDGRIEKISKKVRVHVAPGGYPVYYALAKTNGRFGKFPIKGFRNEHDFKKYLVKSKLEPIKRSERFES